MKNKKYFPMFIDLSDKNVVVVGGGSTAVRRTRTLLQFTRNVTVIAQEPDQELIEMSKLGRINLQQRLVKRSDFQDAYLVLTATADHKLNDDVYRLCKDQGIYVNVSNDKDKCDFQFPGVYIKNDLVVGVSASGLDSTKAKKISSAVQTSIEKSLSSIEDL